MTPTVRRLVGASALLGGGVCASAYYATYAVRSQWLGHTWWRGRADTASVALTFDDGPTEDTERILEILAVYGARAAFFMIGRQVERHPDTARLVAARGHETGNHSWSHPNYLCRGPRETRRQLTRAQDLIASVTGAPPRWSRPPFGVRTPAYFAAARALGLHTVQWTVAGHDWTHRRATRIARRVIGRASPGAIILLHDGDAAGRRDRRETVAALPAIVEGLQARGLRLASLDDLLTSPTHVLTPPLHVDHRQVADD